MQDKGLFIMSLNSKRLFDVLHYKQLIYENIETDNLEVYMFDNYEVLNALFFKIEGGAGEQSENISGIIREVEQNFIDETKIFQFSKHKKELSAYLLAVNNEYYSNAVFERHCKNQIFTNLQPKLKAQGIMNNKSALIELLVPFLLAELAVYLWIYDSGQYVNIYGLEKEMDILIAIQNGKYPAFSRLLNNKVPYHQIQIPTDANA